MDASARARCLETHRSWLGLDPALRGKVDVSGIVQVTLAAASQLATPEGEERTLLRCLLARNLGDESRMARALKCGGGRDVSLEEDVADEALSPASLPARAEQLDRLAMALEAIPETQRQAIALHYLEGLPVAAVGERMGRTVPAVAGLLFRGLAALRQAMG